MFTISAAVKDIIKCICMQKNMRLKIAPTIIEKNRVLPGLEASAGQSSNSALDNYVESMYHNAQDICIQYGGPDTLLPTATTSQPRNNHITNLPHHHVISWQQ